MKKIIVTEKPSVARSFAKTLGVTGKQNGYMENDEWIITWCLGHLVTMCYPQEYDPDLEKWSMDTLPFLPESYRYKIISDAKQQFYVIKRLYHRSDVGMIYYAGDPAREGIYIQALVRQEAGIAPGVDEKVVWIDSQTDAEILRGIKEAKPLFDYANLIDSGYQRAIEDYAVGINFSRALTLKAQKDIGYIPKSVNVGRVMSCVLGMVVRREREIENFVPTDYYRIQNLITLPDGESLVATWTPSSDKYEDKLYNDNGFKKKEDAKALIESLSHRAQIQNVDVKEEKKHAPLLYNLAELQAACSKALKFSPDKTLEVVQSLYEKQMTTYPRTDSRYLSTAVAVEIEGNIRGLESMYSEEVSQILSSNAYKSITSSKYTNDAKVTDHYAIIPTGKVTSLSAEEADVYHMIAKRFLSIFMPPAIYTKVIVTEVDPVCNEKFVASGRTLKDPGYLSLIGYRSDDSKEDRIPKSVTELGSHDEFDCKYRIASSQTTPPNRYTSGSMILAMENAGKLIEDESLREQIKGSGIGTSATRAETLKKLQKIGYIKLNAKTQVLSPESYGYFVYDFVEMILPEFLNPELTAKWERDLDSVARGEISSDAYQKKMEKYVCDSIGKVLETEVSLEQLAGLRTYIANAPAKKRESERQTRVKQSDVATYLDVPFDDKDKAKSLGARWDPAKKSWYVPKGADTSAFASWISGDGAKSVSRIYLDIAYEDKDRAKQAGARWDADKRQWYMMSTNKRLNEFMQ